MLASASQGGLPALGGVCPVRRGLSAWCRGGCLVLGGSPWSGACLPGPGGVCLVWGVASKHGLRQTPPGTESQMPVKTLPWPNFVAAGKNVYVLVKDIRIPSKRHSSSLIISQIS